MAERQLVDYIQYPDSDCLTGGVLKVRDGHKLVDTVSSHHYVLTTGHNLVDINNLAKIFDLEMDVI